jgi:hypothetical protein
MTIALFQGFSPLNGPFTGSIENVRPAPTIAYLPKILVSNHWKAFFKLFGAFARIPSRPYLANLRLGKFGATSSLTASAGKNAAPFGNHICGVVFVGSKKQMARVDAVSNVAPVQDKLAANGSNKTFVNNSMGKTRLPRTVFQRDNKSSVAVVGKRGCPQPATVGLFNFVPKALRKHLFASLLTSRFVSAFCVPCNRSVPHF